MEIGIVGLPNVGKSTLFNALTKTQNAESANYPFCTIEPNKAVVPVPDARVDKLAEIVQPKRVLYSTVDFVDIAGLVKGASKGEGLGNQFLENIRQTEAILHVVRCFDNSDIVHVDGAIDPIRDIETIETELILADLQMLERKMERLKKQAKGDKTLLPVIAEGEKLLAHLEQGKLALTYAFTNPELAETLLKNPGIITAKKVIYCANVDEDGLAEENAYVKAVRDYAARHNSATVMVSAQVEQELAALEPEEQAEFLESYGINESGIEKVIRTGFDLLGLQSYFTQGKQEVRAWTIHKGWKAPKAASVIHNDFEKGFIRAEVIAYEDFITHGSEAKCREAGVLRSEGKEYEVRDGDIIHFLFNV
ncbi:MAG: redox-regulated ATPase YchF [Calditrichaeota bacterium]|nr:MAG: redox-regulated ATPase YchF [Calditrichota bacterium]